MELLPREKDKLLLFTAGLLAERRLNRGLKLNYPEAIAFISMAILDVLEKVSFNQTEDGTYYIKATTFKKEGATVTLHKPGEPGATVTELTSMFIENGAMIIFNDIDSKKKKKGMVYSVQKKMKFIGLPGIMESELNQAHSLCFRLTCR